VSKVYGLDGKRRCDGCVKKNATTRRRIQRIWYALCDECAKEVDRRRKLPGRQA
jgi:hypothetical protein